VYLQKAELPQRGKKTYLSWEMESHAGRKELQTRWGLEM